MDFLAIQNNLRIDMVRTSDGCPEQCSHCGYYELFPKEDLRVREVSLSVLENIFQQTIVGTRKKVKDWFDSRLTTDVGTEPLQTHGFSDFAKLVYTVSEGQSRVITISHGVRRGVKRMYEQMGKIVETMECDAIREFILTMDFERLRGQIPESLNEASYLETLRMLRPVLSRPETKVTISMQGILNASSPQFFGRIQAMYERIRQTLEREWTKEEIEKIRVDTRSSYTRMGRAETLIGKKESMDCEVIPDKELVAQIRSQGTVKYRGRIDGFRRILEVQQLRSGKTYGDTVQQNRWTTLYTFNI